jgi:formiminotetrahydrofolate cyclodeaminase
MDLKETTLAQFTDLLGSKAAAPGGGGASALAGALGAALGAMVGSLTVGKKKYAAVEAEMQELTQRAQALSQRLLDLVQKDAVAFEPLSRAYAIPKDDPTRTDVMEACLRRAADVPLEIMRCCCEAIELQEEFAQKGSVLAVSDAATGAALCFGALQGAAVNVKVNTALMTRRDYAQEINREVDQRLADYGARAAAIFDAIYRRYC